MAKLKKSLLVRYPATNEVLKKTTSQRYITNTNNPSALGIDFNAPTEESYTKIKGSKKFQAAIKDEISQKSQLKSFLFPAKAKAPQTVKPSLPSLATNSVKDVQKGLVTKHTQKVHKSQLGTPVLAEGQDFSIELTKKGKNTKLANLKPEHLKTVYTGSHPFRDANGELAGYIDTKPGNKKPVMNPLYKIGTAESKGISKLNKIESLTPEAPSLKSIVAKSVVDLSKTDPIEWGDFSNPKVVKGLMAKRAKEEYGRQLVDHVKKENLKVNSKTGEVSKGSKVILEKGQSIEDFEASISQEVGANPYSKDKLHWTGVMLPKGYVNPLANLSPGFAKGLVKSAKATRFQKNYGERAIRWVHNKEKANRAIAATEKVNSYGKMFGNAEKNIFKDYTTSPQQRWTNEDVHAVELTNKRGLNSPDAPKVPLITITDKRNGDNIVLNADTIKRDINTTGKHRSVKKTGERLSELYDYIWSQGRYEEYGKRIEGLKKLQEESIRRDPELFGNLAGDSAVETASKEALKIHEQNLKNKYFNKKGQKIGVVPNTEEHVDNLAEKAKIINTTVKADKVAKDEEARNLPTDVKDSVQTIRTFFTFPDMKPANPAFRTLKDINHPYDEKKMVITKGVKDEDGEWKENIPVEMKEVTTLKSDSEYSKEVAKWEKDRQEQLNILENRKLDKIINNKHAEEEIWELNHQIPERMVLEDSDHPTVIKKQLADHYLHKEGFIPKKIIKDSVPTKVESIHNTPTGYRLQLDDVYRTEATGTRPMVTQQARSLKDIAVEKIHMDEWEKGHPKPQQKVVKLEEVSGLSGGGYKHEIETTQFDQAKHDYKVAMDLKPGPHLSEELIKERQRVALQNYKDASKAFITEVEKINKNNPKKQWENQVLEIRYVQNLVGPTTRKVFDEKTGMMVDKVIEEKQSVEKLNKNPEKKGKTTVAEMEHLEKKFGTLYGQKSDEVPVLGTNNAGTVMSGNEYIKRLQIQHPAVNKIAEENAKKEALEKEKAKAAAKSKVPFFKAVQNDKKLFDEVVSAAELNGFKLYDKNGQIKTPWQDTNSTMFWKTMQSLYNQGKPLTTDLMGKSLRSIAIRDELKTSQEYDLPLTGNMSESPRKFIKKSTRRKNK